MSEKKIINIYVYMSQAQNCNNIRLGMIEGRVVVGA